MIVGPFNEHLLTDTSRAKYRELMRTIEDWLKQNDVPFVAPEALPSDEYADASHPLPAGYRQMAEAIIADEKFQQWQNAR